MVFFFLRMLNKNLNLAIRYQLIKTEPRLNCTKICLEWVYHLSYLKVYRLWRISVFNWKNWQIGNVGSMWVPHELSLEKRTKCSTICTSLSIRYAKLSFLHHTVTGDEPCMSRENEKDIGYHKMRNWCQRPKFPGRNPRIPSFVPGEWWRQLQIMELRRRTTRNDSNKYPKFFIYYIKMEKSNANVMII